jgi:hypothetical protein
MGKLFVVEHLLLGFLFLQLHLVSHDTSVRINWVLLLLDLFNEFVKTPIDFGYCNCIATKTIMMNMYNSVYHMNVFPFFSPTKNLVRILTDVSVCHHFAFTKRFFWNTSLTQPGLEDQSICNA